MNGKLTALLLALTIASEGTTITAAVSVPMSRVVLVFKFSQTWCGSRGGSGGSVEPPKLNVKTCNKRVVKKKVNQGDFGAIKPLQIAPENAGNRISEALKLKTFPGGMPPEPPRGYRLQRAFIRIPLRQILDLPQQTM